MDDPWDVKSVRQSGHYTSCMKLNGVPLLPPLLSKECRKEMKYYKLLAKEVENRISLLQPYIDTDSSHSSEDKTDAPEIPECDQDYEIPKRSIAADFDLNIDHIDVTKEKNLDETLTGSSLHTELYNISSEQVVLQTADKTSQQLIIDFNVNISDTGRDPENKERNSPSLPIEVPERDYNCTKQRELLTDVETKNARCKKEKDKIIEDFVNFSVTVAKNKFTDLFSDNSSKDGIQSLSSKSFTGSLNNIHTESAKSVHSVSKLVRQRSYTVLNPSPQLLAHLEVQSLNLGVEMSCISMSDSLSNLSTPNKKRRSWDLESAKVKWSNMALELKQKNLGSTNNRNMKGQPTKRSLSPPVARSVALDRTRRSSLSLKPTPKTEPIHKIRKHSPLRSIPSNTTIILEELPSCRSGKEDKFVKSVKEPTSPKAINHKKETHEPISPKTREPSKVTSHTKKEPQASKSPENITIKVREVNKSSTPKPQSTSASGDPAAKVRELYEKIKKQQLVQMASLVEKQKREQLLLQQVFEEQNNLLFKQLKTICPKSPVEAKEAWADKTREPDRGPVSLSQLINPKSPEAFNSPLSSTLTESNKYISHCEDVLKKSRDISGSIKKTGKAQVQNGSKVQSPKNQLDSRTRTNSPTRRSTPTSRRLNYDTSASSDHEPILTDRTNDTMADLNVTFPSDSEECQPYSQNGTLNHLCGEEVTVIHTSPTPRNSARSTDSAIKCMEQTIQNSINSSYPRRSKAPLNHQPTLKQQTAASKIVAYAKGYLVRRLMKTARVQSTVQTIKDALLCALQLHQDREGIRGADVDLHRRLIQQITAACYSLHDTFIASTASERCAVIAADRGRRSSLANRPPPPLRRHSDIMSQSHSGVFAPRPKRFSSSSASLMTQSNYETYSSEKTGRARYMPSPWRRPWR